MRKCALLLASFAIAAQAQSFEAASVGPAKAGDRTDWSGGPGTRDPGQIAYTAVTLRDLIEQAYHLYTYQIRGGAAWLGSERYTVIAKLPAGASKRDLRVMLQGLLAERFKVSVRHESEEGRNFRLVVDKEGPKLKPPTEGTPADRASFAPDEFGGLNMADNTLGRPVTLSGKKMIALVGGNMVHILANSQAMSALATQLTAFMGGPVSDATGLTGVYDFSLDFTLPTESRFPQTGVPGEPIMPLSEPQPEASVFQALREQLGLRLDSTRGPVEILIVDRAERVPTGN